MLFPVHAAAAQIEILMEALKMSAYVLFVIIVSSLTDADFHIITSNAITYGSAATHGKRSDTAVHSVRYRRQARALTTQQMQEIVDVHNELRAVEGSSDMELMTWNNFLASLAEGWAAGCDWKHGQPPLGDNPQYSAIGQNLFATTGSRINLTSAVANAWVKNEKPYYDYDTLECADGEVCGHYTQVVWATSRHVGCAYQLCRPLAGLGSAYSSALYLVCNYGPAGNYGGTKPFAKGPACSKCGTGAGWCKNGLCNSACSSPGQDCSCAAHCYNCAELDLNTCRCLCADGWRGTDCSVRCEDTHRYCNVSPGWPPSTCGTDYVQRNCPAMCKLCTADPDAVADKCEPVYGPDAYSTASPTFVVIRQLMIVMMTMTIIAFSVNNNAAL